MEVLAKFVNYEWFIHFKIMTVYHPQTQRHVINTFMECPIRWLYHVLFKASCARWIGQNDEGKHDGTLTEERSRDESKTCFISSTFVIKIYTILKNRSNSEILIIKIFCLSYNTCLLTTKCLNSQAVIWKYRDHRQWRSQNVEKVTHIKGRLLGQAMVLFYCVPFHNGNFS